MHDVVQYKNPSFAKFKLGFSCLASRASSLWRPKKSRVLPSSGGDGDPLLTKSKTGWKTQKNGVALFERESFDKFSATETSPPFLGVVSLPSCALAPARPTLATDFAGGHP